MLIQEEIGTRAPTHLPGTASPWQPRKTQSPAPATLASLKEDAQEPTLGPLAPKKDTQAPAVDATTMDELVVESEKDGVYGGEMEKKVKLRKEFLHCNKGWKERLMTVRDR